MGHINVRIRSVKPIPHQSPLTQHSPSSSSELLGAGHRVEELHVPAAQPGTPLGQPSGAAAIAARFCASWPSCIHAEQETHIRIDNEKLEALQVW